MAGNEFESVFIAESSTISSVDKFRPFIALDACFIKSRFQGSMLIILGIIMLATNFDSQNKIVILAYAISERECTANWQWFFENFQSAYKLLKNDNLTIVSDKDKVILAAVQVVFPNAKHGRCLKHFADNIKSKCHNMQLILESRRSYIPITDQQIYGRYQGS